MKIKHEKYLKDSTKELESFGGGMGGSFSKSFPKRKRKKIGESLNIVIKSLKVLVGAWGEAFPKALPIKKEKKEAP